MNVPSQTRNSVSEDRLAFVVLCLGFVLTGVVTVLIGQVLPVFINRWGMSDQLAGFFFTTQFLGSLLGTLLSSVIVQAKGFRYAIVLGFLMIVLGVGALNTGSKLLAFAAVATYGGGYGLVVPGTNLWVAENSGHRSAAALNVLNLAWGIGAVSCPGLILFAYSHPLPFAGALSDCGSRRRDQRFVTVYFAGFQGSYCASDKCCSVHAGHQFFYRRSFKRSFFCLCRQ